jgi:hypothetical protein
LVASSRGAFDGPIFRMVGRSAILGFSHPRAPDIGGGPSASLASPTHLGALSDPIGGPFPFFGPSAEFGPKIGPFWPRFDLLDLFEKNQESSEGPANPLPPRGGQRRYNRAIGGRGAPGRGHQRGRGSRGNPLPRPDPRFPPISPGSAPTRPRVPPERKGPPRAPRWGRGSVRRWPRGKTIISPKPGD